MTDGTDWPGYAQQDIVLRDFDFANGQHLDELTLRCRTLGTLRRDADGRAANAALLLHNTTGSGASWLDDGLADELFGAGQPLDLADWYVVIPDMVGFGGSSKPSDGMRASFPNYRYVDMVTSTHRMLTDGLGVNRLALVLGLSMGGMLTWMWGEMFPDFMERLVPVATQPGPMSGRNWIQRRISIEAIRNDPDWNNGDYETNPTRYVVTAPYSGLLIQSVVRLQEKAPTREAGDALYAQLVERAKKGDANNRLYQVEASMDYDPTPTLDRIRAAVLALNFEDDELNPPQLGTVEPAIARLPDAEYVLVPASRETNGHYTTLLANVWAPYLAEFLSRKA